MVQDVKELGPELNVEISPVCLDVIVLEYGEIDVEQAWPDYRVPSGIAK